MQFTIYQESIDGCREVNEDRVAHAYERETLLLIVADGMGGHPDGEFAADICVRVLSEQFRREAKPVVKNPLGFLRRAMVRAHEAVQSYALQQSLPDSPRTTCVACVVQAGVAYWAHCGDSRLYLFRQGRLVDETSDHSEFQRLLDTGGFAAPVGPDHPARHRLYSCLGGSKPPLLEFRGGITLLEADVLVLSSDGFWSVMTKREIAESLASRPMLEFAPHLMRIAEQRGGSHGDNVSAIFVRWGGEAFDDPAPASTC